MKQLLPAAGAVVFVTALGATAAPPDAAIPFPADYRNWVHVKTTLVGPGHPSFATNGGYHHFYANAAALEGYRSGRFPDGALLVDDGIEAIDKYGVAVEGPRRRVAVMAKDSRRFGDTGNWSFEVFLRDTRDPSLTADGRAACFACHQKAPRDLVYSTFRQ